jgi:acylphosphatase
MIRLTAYVSGRVRWTGYEAKVISLAKEIGLMGIIQNRPDDRVLVIAEGEKRDDLERFASAIQINDGITDVRNIEVEYTGASGAYSDFRKVTGPDEIYERLDEGIREIRELMDKCDIFRRTDTENERRR